LNEKGFKSQVVKARLENHAETSHSKKAIGLTEKNMKGREGENQRN